MSKSVTRSRRRVPPRSREKSNKWRFSTVVLLMLAIVSALGAGWFYFNQIGPGPVYNPFASKVSNTMNEYMVACRHLSEDEASDAVKEEVLSDFARRFFDIREELSDDLEKAAVSRTIMGIYTTLEDYQSAIKLNKEILGTELLPEDDRHDLTLNLAELYTNSKVIGNDVSRSEVEGAYRASIKEVEKKSSPMEKWRIYKEYADVLHAFGDYEKSVDYRFRIITMVNGLQSPYKNQFSSSPTAPYPSGFSNESNFEQALMTANESSDYTLVNKLIDKIDEVELVRGKSYYFNIALRASDYANSYLLEKVKTMLSGDVKDQYTALLRHDMAIYYWIAASDLIQAAKELSRIVNENECSRIKDKEFRDNLLADTHYYLYYCMKNTGNKKQATFHLNKLIQVNPSDPRIKQAVK